MRKILLSTLFWIVLCPCGAFSSAQYVVIKDGINARVDSTVTSQSLGCLDQNTIVEVIGDKFKWRKIILPKKFDCYIYKTLTVDVEGHKVRVVAANVNLRANPSLTAAVIGRAPKEAVFPKVEETERWVKIKGYPYINGWVHKRFLELREEFDFAAFVAGILPELAESDMGKKMNLHQEIIRKGPEVIPVLEGHIPTAGKNTTYSIISILSRFARDNPDLTRHFLKKARKSPLKIASVYLDILENTVTPGQRRKAYFYRAVTGRLSLKEVKKTLVTFQETVDKITGP